MRERSSGVLTLTYMNQSPLKSPVVLMKNDDGVQTDSVLGEIQFVLILSLLQQTQLLNYFSESLHECSRNNTEKIKEIL